MLDKLKFWRKRPAVANSADGGPLLQAGSDNPQRAADIIFIHGLDGNMRTTWQNAGNPPAFWPAMLAEDLPDFGVWSVGYEVASIGWKGHSMALPDRATNILALFEAYRLGERPTIFIAHSLGGLVLKQMLNHGLTLGNESWSNIARQTKGVIFLSTPHHGSGLASWMQYLKVLRPTASIDLLRADEPNLNNLNL